MNLLKKIFGSKNFVSEDDDEKGQDKLYPEISASLDEQFVYNFMKNGGKFLYCENIVEVKDHIENILEENDWFEKEALCYEPELFSFLEENKIPFKKVQNPTFLLAKCENLIASEGSILLSSKQIKQNKPNELPANIIIIATISQIISTKSDGLSGIRNKYAGDLPSNITAIKYFKKVIEEDFTQYGSTAKNLYLLLLEDLQNE